VRREEFGWFRGGGDRETSNQRPYPVRARTTPPAKKKNRGPPPGWGGFWAPRLKKEARARCTDQGGRGDARGVTCGRMPGGGGGGKRGATREGGQGGGGGGGRVWGGGRVGEVNRTWTLQSSGGAATTGPPPPGNLTSEPGLENRRGHNQWGARSGRAPPPGWLGRREEARK